MSFEEIPHRALVRGLLLVLAWGLASCGSTQPNMKITTDLLATPPHRMSRSEYPFDASGRYVDAWAAEGAGRYGRSINSDRTDDGRSDATAAPERRPPPPPRAESPSRPPKRTASTPPRPDKTTAKPAAKPASKPGAKPGAKPASKPAAKPAAKPRTASHTVKRGDSLSKLSQRYGVSIQAIKKANNLKSNLIQDGRRLVIPKN